MCQVVTDLLPDVSEVSIRQVFEQSPKTVGVPVGHVGIVLVMGCVSFFAVICGYSMGILETRMEDHELKGRAARSREVSSDHQQQGNCETAR